MISHEFLGLVLVSGITPCHVPVGVTLSYDAEEDPLAVQMICSSPDRDDVVWRFARELLTAGADSPVEVGEGDVRVRRTSEYYVRICLRTPPEGHADLGLPHREVADFLEETSELASTAEEHFDGLIDGLIGTLLNGEEL